MYDDIVELADASPSWLQTAGILFTEAGLLAFAVLFVWMIWRARASPARLAVALLPPAGTALAYVISEGLKSVIQEDRPCRNLVTLVACPPTGDWSFPSNHSTIAAAAAVGLALAWRRLAPWVLPGALLMGFSRVFVGAHYPHDVLAGLVLGSVTAWLVFRYLSGPATGIARRLTAHAGDAPTQPMPRVRLRGDSKGPLLPPRR
ncbi:phosphatase PAP2 family protein [Amycolatopsis alba]|uniref:phosphatase PAP2 family protein n=1 Tax=Amycolatopsis alba TaxID=76020 RepID=UPI000366BBB1|nr:phosphatase PAP2 family protein [Amycolatopsis alba]